MTLRLRWVGTKTRLFQSDESSETRPIRWHTTYCIVLDHHDIASDADQQKSKGREHFAKHTAKEDQRMSNMSLTDI